MASPTFALTDILIRGWQTNSQVTVSGVPSRRDKKKERLIFAGYRALGGVVGTKQEKHNQHSDTLKQTFYCNNISATNRLFYCIKPCNQIIYSTLCGKKKPCSIFQPPFLIQLSD